MAKYPTLSFQRLTPYVRMANIKPNDNNQTLSAS